MNISSKVYKTAYAKWPFFRSKYQDRTMYDNNEMTDLWFLTKMHVSFLYMYINLYIKHVTLRWDYVWLYGHLNRLGRSLISNIKRRITQLYALWFVTMQNRWNNRISDGCVYAQIRKGLGMHLVTYSNHDTVPFLLIVPIKGRFV